MLKWLKENLDRFAAPELDWVQVELTTYCNSFCVYCPQTAMSATISKKHIPLDLFRKLMPFLRYTKMIYLQGWGEPLLHPNLFEMIQLCKNQNKVVGFTTNGMALDEKTIHRIIDLKLDILGVSLAGATPESHNKFRRGNDFDRLIKNLQLLNRIKTERNSTHPALHLAFLMLKSNFHEMEALVSLAKGMGVKQIVASNLSLILNKALYAEALFNDIENTGCYLNTLKKLKKIAAAKGILFTYSRPDLDETSMCCSENVGHACVVNVDGNVSPCVFMDPILIADSENYYPKPVYYRFRNRDLLLNSISFGNIQTENLTRIWNKIEYDQFRNRFELPPHLRITTDLPDSCKYCYKRLLKYQ